MLCRADSLLLAFCLLGGVVAAVPVGAKESDERGETGITTARTRFFEVAGRDADSVYRVENLADHVVRSAERYLPALPESFPKSILVTLRPSDTEAFEGPYQVRSEPLGLLRLDIRWSRNLELETVCYALTEALVRAYALYHHGSGADEEAPAWVIAALGGRSYLRLRPAEVVTYQDWQREAGLPALRDVLERTEVVTDADNGRDGVVVDRTGHLLFVLLRESRMQRRNIQRVIAASIAGEDVMEILADYPRLTGSGSSEQENGENGENGENALEDWWLNQAEKKLSKPMEYYETMEDSLNWISRMMEFEDFVGQDQDVEVENLRDLWEHRENEGLRNALEARIQIIHLRLERVNPLYHNVARSLAVLYESVLEEEQMHVFIRTLTRFLSEFEDSKRLQEETENLLDKE